MKIGVQGIMPMYRNTVVEIVESIENPAFTHIDQPGIPGTTIAFQCDGDDADAMAALVKSTLRASAWGKGHAFFVTSLA